MILKDLLAHFDISVVLPQYLYGESFNDVFLKGELSFIDGGYKITIKTQKEVTHTIFINEKSNYPVCVLSELKNGALNGIKFGLNKGDLKYF